MYTIRRSIDLDFAHHVRGHLGPCINLHGHTWKFEVGLSAQTLDEQGFVSDFGQLSAQVLAPAEALLDHSLAVGEATYTEIRQSLVPLGEGLLSSRERVHGPLEAQPTPAPIEELPGVRLERPGGLKVVVFAFNPTSERIAEWLYQLAHSRLADERVSVEFARVFETLHPVESVAEYRAAVRS